MSRVFIIAEAGVNHNGSVTLAKQLIDIAADCGADAVKFQTFTAENIVSKTAPKAEYQTRTTDVSETQYSMIKKLELDEAAHRELMEHSRMRGIQFLTTPFDSASVRLLKQFDLPLIKVSSGDITNGPLLLEIALTGKSVILSTGMSTLGEIEAALGVLAYGYINPSQPPSSETFQMAYRSEAGRLALQQKVTLLHCTTEYPALYGDVNLRVMDTLRKAFNLSVGLSDHTHGISIPIAASALGAAVIEKHFTLDKNLPGPDHKASLEPEELKTMIRSIREVEEAMGSSVKIPVLSELKNKPIARKSLVAGHTIKKGEIFTKENLVPKRPGDGLSPMLYWDILGEIAERDYEKDEQVVP